MLCRLEAPVCWIELSEEQSSYREQNGRYKNRGILEIGYAFFLMLYIETELIIGKCKFSEIFGFMWQNRVLVEWDF